MAINDRKTDSATIHAALHSLGQLPLWVWAVLLIAVVRTTGCASDTSRQETLVTKLRT